MRKYKCPNCDAVEVLKENDVRICTHCGFQTMVGYKDDSEQMKMMLATAPKIIQALMFFDEKLQQYWVPTFLNIPAKGMVFPEGNEDEWNWTYCPIIAIPITERMKYPVPGKEDEYYETRLNLDAVEYFDKLDFKNAAIKVGYSPDIE